ncbi:hypothetical protein DSM106972_084810 [Dulcicalothrix desertica PCC 7102]|uniref:ATPase AAA-type core domain-containing protein n=1 Tax=Dulcicalothrix desertica PCC 7102 TaxID=232991 RepID=A0A433UU68_9CYAN|nr:AAA family ATPase [Dulcicalothrix desertica]RUS97378.1 hypothetical protein DSM106972_084810 [Dulcicalothrix desertica PCC 7102]TWH55556.1 putative ATPase [Dulcicalothrix desertica PCC 7102]
MPIKSIHVSNFKSFRDSYIELGKLNILIGANASGKSNFLQILKFLRDIRNFGLDNAISLQGGVEYLINTRINTSQEFKVNIVFDDKHERFIKKNNQTSLLKILQSSYELSIQFSPNHVDFVITEDKLIQNCEIYNFHDESSEQKNKIANSKIVLSKNQNKIDIDYRSDNNSSTINKFDVLPIHYFASQELKSNTVLLENPFLSLLMPEDSDTLKNVSIYDFDHKLTKKATPITGKLELEEDGTNLPIVIKKIIREGNSKRKLLNLLSVVLPFVKDLKIEEYTDKSLIFQIKEQYLKNDNNYIPSSLISDGTVNIIALLIALYFENEPLTIIEEPERNIHPYLISKIIEMMKEASMNKQIIVTTHNPEMVKYANRESILLISRDKQGFSQISRPYEQEEIKIFLENQIEFEELYVKNLLSI